MVFANHELKLREIADTLKISESRVFTNLHKDLSYFLFADLKRKL